MAIGSDIQQQVFDLLSKASNFSFVSADRDTAGIIGLTPGQRVTAQVLTTLPDSRVQVRLGSETLNLNLPMPVRSGQNLELTFVSSEPRSTFAIARQGGTTPPITLSDASRLLGLLAHSEQINDPRLRSSLQSISGLLRSSAGESGVLANLMDEALTYGTARGGETALPRTAAGSFPVSGGETATAQARLTAFESGASQILLQIARNSRFTLVEAINSPVVPLSLLPGQEVDAAVQGTLPGGRAFVTVAGTTLELVLPRTVQQGEILRLTFISSDPKPTFAMARPTPEGAQGGLSNAGRWLSSLEHSQGGISVQQSHVLDRLASVLRSLPADSPAFTAILDEAITYQTVMEGGRQHGAESAVSLMARQATQQQGNGIVLSDDMARLLQALIRGNRLALVEALNQQTQGVFFSAGQQLKGEVLASLGGGHFTVLVAGQMLEFTMPRGTRLGDRVSLFYIAGNARPTFLMTRFGRPGDSRVSETGRWLSGFLGSTAESAPAQETLGILRILLSGPPTDGAHVGSMLQQGLRESGLFYESHLARWFGGEYQLEDLLREPQGRLSRLNQSLPDTPPLDHQGEGTPQPALKDATLEAMEAAFQKAGRVLGHEDVADQSTLPLLRQQLESLQSGQIIFRGQLFEGQPLEWAVGEREARRNREGGQERTWDTTLRVDLPRLGAVAARLTLDGNRVAIELRAGESGAVELLGRERGKLVEQLQAAGLEPAEIGVLHDES
ncbi:flagellar hook-length control protein FliK [Pelobacter propionicus]|uniref:Flagellar hook-length control protein-like C-terminal domain-containing protein n=1 Tax=Pelobacter propionicus (strain DSM 2379 / NBRC 103807 / OttBd1) TaxID=338966 RepID=A1AUI8_PELPD|nr:flagellar hook-length control protein FliK [Pelobacter propionicus]ABL01009.1 hypothetical protein Ppro_3416 [Pelobacter propionicus DSM 2379]